MRKVGLYSLLLIVGLVLSQALPHAVGSVYSDLGWLLRTLTMTSLSYIMIQVGYHFDIDKRRAGSLAWDYVVAMTAAAFPWIFCALYFVFVMAPAELWTDFQFWKESLLVSRFAAPTSAGVLFSMLTGAGLSATWVFRKARILAIFDDLDTILLLIPLQMLMVGARWQMGVLVGVIALLLWVAWRYLHRLSLPRTWPWVLTYALSLALICEGLYYASLWWDPTAPLHLEVLLPAFVLGCTMARPKRKVGEETPASPVEERASTLVSAAFMLLAGLSMPLVDAAPSALPPPAGVPNHYQNVAPDVLAAKDHFPGWDIIAWHVFALWTLSNFGKLFPVLCYRQTASRRERFALGVSMFPRGEVGTGVLVISVFYGVAAPILTAATLTLCINLICTGLFILIVRQLLVGVPVESKRAPPGLSLGTVSALQDSLRAHMGEPGGLDYAVFLPKALATDGTIQVTDDDPYAVSQSLDEHLENFALAHNPAEQVRHWRRVVPEIHRCFKKLEANFPVAEEKPAMSMTRLVLDVEVGGLLLAVVGDRGWIFAASLDQQAMNDGRAEQELVELVKDLGDVLTAS